MSFANQTRSPIGGTFRGRVLNQLPTAVVLMASAAAIWFRVQGLNRSLWLDETWVANAVLERSIGRILVYPNWVPAPEPGFLLSSRLLTTVFGTSNLIFRAVPAAFSLIGLLVMFLLLRRLFSPAWTAVGFTLFALSPIAIEYANTFKQYSTELSMVLLLLMAAVRWNEQPTRFNFVVLLLTVVITPIFAYPIVFIIPAIFIMLLSRPTCELEIRHVMQAVSAVFTGFVTFAILYFLVIRRNMSGSLRLYFAHGGHAVGFVGSLKRDISGLLNPFKELLPIPWRYIQPQRMSLAVLCALGLVAAAVLLYRARRGYRPWLVLAVSFPFFTLFCVDLLNIYPVTGRTTLFLLPCRIILVIAGLELTVSTIHQIDFKWFRPLAIWVAPTLAGLILCIGSVRQQHYEPVRPRENPQDAIACLKAEFHDGDGLYVHASMEENFKLYARLLNFRPVGVQWGNTGWPCCPRHVEFWRGRGSVLRVDEDLTRLYGTALPERLWILETLRASHWDYIGLNEPAVLEELLFRRGCTLISHQEWRNVGLNLFQCGIRDRPAQIDKGSAEHSAGTFGPASGRRK